mgnify:CR=1 FL=1
MNTAASPTSKIPIPTSLGVFVVSYSPKGLSSLRFPDPQATLEVEPNAAACPDPQWHRLTTTALQSLLAGSAPVELPPFDISPGTEFQQRVWKALLEIPFGQTKTYSEIAKQIGNPEAVRAVGGACGANRIPVLIPCHRVLAAGHRIGGFSGGLDWKRVLLKLEGITAFDSSDQPLLL